MKTIFVLAVTLAFHSSLMKAQTQLFVDPRDGKEYSVEIVDGLEWMKDNLAYDTEECYRMADAPMKPPGLAGNYYDYTEAGDVCPDGWRLPSREEWFSFFRVKIADIDASLALTDKYVPKKKNEGWILEGYGEDFDLMGKGIVSQAGRVEGEVLQLSQKFVDYWVDSASSAYEDRAHVHINNSWITVHGHEHHMNIKRKGQLRKFMIRCVR